MNEVLLALVETININILVFAAIGAIFGESKRELSDDIDMKLSSFIKDILLSFGAAIVLGIIVFELTDKVFISSFAAILSGYNGHKFTINLLNGLLEKIAIKD